MQTMNFQCGHCRNLMAVSAEYLGQQVRCPTCGGVVIAPAAPGGPAPEGPRQPEPPRFEAFDTESHEDIFTQPSETDDALFGAGADAPRIDLPRAPEPAPPPPDLEVTPRSVVMPETLPTETPTTGWSPLTTTGTEAQPQTVHLQPQPEPQPPVEAPYVPSEPRRPKAAPKVDWFIPLVVFPLILYAIGITAVAVFLYMRLVAVPPSLLDRIPDVEGDDPGVVRLPKVSLQFKRDDALAPLPEHLRVKLAETLRVGDLEVTPLRVERKKVAVHVKGHKPEPCQHESLVLHLRLTNVGTDSRFTPIDNYFDRHWDGKSGSAPLTVLVAGRNHFFGGPAKWVARSDKRERRQWVEGRKDGDPKGIGPGESMETITCTDGDNPKCEDLLFGNPKLRINPYRGNLLWRVQLRRGLIEHRGRELPATCVVGVEFSSKDYGGG
jgi:hypothetical protein